MKNRFALKANIYSIYLVQGCISIYWKVEIYIYMYIWSGQISKWSASNLVILKRKITQREWDSRESWVKIVSWHIVLQASLNDICPALKWKEQAWIKKSRKVPVSTREERNIFYLWIAPYPNRFTVQSQIRWSFYASLSIWVPQSS